MFILIILTLIVILFIALVVLHSYLKYGFRLTFNFFLFSFLYVSKWLLKNLDNQLAAFKTAQQVRIFETLAAGKSIFYKNILISLGNISVIFGWMFLFYFGWYLANKIVERLKGHNGRVFPTLLLAGLIIACAVYIIETLGNSLGWWGWSIPVSGVDKYLVGCPFHPIKKSFYFSIYFLAAYFLIECTRFKRTNWKTIFFIIPFIHIFTITIFGTGDLPRFIEHILSFAILAILTLFSRLDFEFNFTFNRPRLFQILDKTILLIILAILLSLSITNIIVMKQPLLNVSLLPFVILLLFALDFIPIYFILTSASILILLFKHMAFPIFIPVVTILILKYFVPILNKEKG
ncbi:MAG: hypothetical protein ISS47_01655 [Candidatus Omnitrophica bacterium]|nr:hypothetical protein [Candidatus Omnitrophota bacterium]